MKERHEVTAWVVKGLVSRGERSVDRRGNPWNHAEVVALRRAGKRARGSHVLTTLEPCVMCAGFLSRARASGVSWGQADSTSGAWSMGLAPSGLSVQGPLAPKSQWQGAPEMRRWRKSHPTQPWPRADWFWWEYGRDHGWRQSRALWKRLSQIVSVPPGPWRDELRRVERLATRRRNPMGFTWMARAWGFAMGPLRMEWHRRASHWLALQ